MVSTSASSSSKSDRPVGFMQRMTNLKVLVTGLIVVSMGFAGLSTIPGLFELDRDALNGNGVVATPVSTPVGEEETVFTLHGNQYSRKDVQALIAPYATQRLIDALADPGMAPQDVGDNLTATLSSVISAMVIDQVVQDAGVRVDDQAVQAKLDAFIAEHFTDKAAYEKALTAFDITEAGMRQQLRFPMEAEALTDKRYPITQTEIDAQIQPVYDATYTSGKIVYQMQFPTLKEADAAMGRVVKGEDFQTVAKELSRDPGSAPKGGLIGPWQPGILDEAFDQAVEGTEPGHMGGPFQSTFGWHIIRVEAAPALDEIREEIKEQARKGIQANNWVQLAAILEDEAGLIIDPRFGFWKGMAFGGLANIAPQPIPASASPGHPSPSLTEPAQSEPAVRATPTSTTS